MCPDKDQYDSGSNSESMQREIERHDQFLDDVAVPMIFEGKMERNSETIKFAVWRRNVLARRIGAEERDWNSEFSVFKHVAVYVGPESNGLSWALRAVLSLGGTCFSVYTSMDELITSIHGGLVCGVLSLSTQGQDSMHIESMIRRELENRVGWGNERARDVILPPCIDESGSIPLLTIRGLILKLWSGDVGTLRDVFVLEAALAFLLRDVTIPDQVFNIIVIDDAPSEVEGILTILNAWNAVSVHSHYPTSKSTVESIADFVGGKSYDLILLDESIGCAASGSEVYAELVRRGAESSKIVSITSGSRPPVFQKHFYAKCAVVRDYGVAKAFVDFINQLISKSVQGK